MILCSSSTRTSVSLEDALAAISGAGFTDVDILAINTWCHINPAHLAADYDAVTARVEELLIKNQIDMRAMNIGFSHQMHDRRRSSVQQNLAECEALCRFMRYFGARVAALQPLQNDPLRDKQEVLDDCILSLKEYYECAHRHGIKLGLELHVNSPFEDMDAMKYLFNVIPDAGVVYDPSHFTSQGMDLKESEFIIKNSVHSHVRDSGPGNIQAPLGKGAVDFNWVVEKLKEYGYKGHFSIEYLDNGEWDALEEAVKMKQLLQKYTV